MNHGLEPPPGLLLEGNVADNWEKFKQRLDLYMIASAYDEKPEKVQASLFLHIIGPAALEVFNTFEFEADTDKEKLAKVKEKFEAYCKPKRNVTFERHVFFTRNQREGEGIDRWVTDLRKLSSSCEFGVLRDSLIKDMLVLGLSDKGVKERLLRDYELTLEKAITTCRASETSKMQLNYHNQRRS
jgi:hypothetical protein